MRGYTVFEDDMHAWVRVPFAEILRLGIQNDITPYSFLKNGVAYLEEDTDLVTWYKAHEAKYGEAPRLNAYHINGESRIRSYPRYKI